MIKVTSLEIGDRVKFNARCDVYVRSIEHNRVVVSKQNEGTAIFYIPFYTHKYDDLINRVTLVVKNES